MTDKKRNLKKVSIATLTMDEAIQYYKGDSKLVELFEQLVKLRARVKKTPGQDAKKPLMKKIAEVKQSIREGQFAYYKKLKKISLISASKESRGGIIKEHPGELTFHLSQTVPVDIPVFQAKQLLKEGVALEVKS